MQFFGQSVHWSVRRGGPDKLILTRLCRGLLAAAQAAESRRDVARDGSPCLCAHLRYHRTRILHGHLWSFLAAGDVEICRLFVFLSPASRAEERVGFSLVQRVTPRHFLPSIPRWERIVILSTRRTEVGQRLSTTVCGTVGKKTKRHVRLASGRGTTLALGRSSMAPQEPISRCLPA